MDAFLQIIVICTNQCIAKIPRIFFECVIVYAKAECFHIFYHKYGSRTGVSLAERVNLPNIRSKFSQMLYSRINRQTLIRKLLFGGKIIVQSFLNTVPIRINNSVAVQYPLFLCNVVLPDLSCVTEHALEQSAMNRKPLGGGKLKRFFSQQLCNSCRNNVRFFGFIFRFGAYRTLLIVTALYILQVQIANSCQAYLHLVSL